MIRRSETVGIVNERGLHARASAKFVTLVAEIADGLAVTVERDGHSATGGSIMGLMMLGAAKGSAIAIHVEGADEARVEAALGRLAGLVRDGFGED